MTRLRCFLFVATLTLAPLAGCRNTRPSAPAYAGAIEAAPVRSIPADRVWTCPMHPGVRRPEPGTCPVCSMDLVPVGDSAHEARQTAPARSECSHCG